MTPYVFPTFTHSPRPSEPKPKMAGEVWGMGPTDLKRHVAQPPAGWCALCLRCLASQQFRLDDRGLAELWVGVHVCGPREVYVPAKRRKTHSNKRMG